VKEREKRKDLKDKSKTKETIEGKKKIMKKFICFFTSMFLSFPQNHKGKL